MTEFDPKQTFETFVVGPANRLACAAARRAADSPGTSYNPLFLYSNSGLGKSHILAAVANHAKKTNSQVRVLYQTLEGYLNELTEALVAGERDRMRDRYRDLDILLLDDVQFLAGQAEAQEMLLGALDALTASGSQIVLASDRPPSDINGLDARLVSRFSGGLTVDIGPPEFETRVAIITRKVAERGQELADGVAEALARVPFKNVRELGGALNRILAVQDLEGRTLGPGDIPDLVGLEVTEGTDPFGSFLNEVSGAVEAEVVHQEAPWRAELRSASEIADREGFSSRALRKLLESKSEPAGWQGRLDTFRNALGRLREIDRELDRIDNPWPDASVGLLKDPDRLDEAEAFLGSVRERQRPFPAIADGPDLEGLSGSFAPLAVRAAVQLVGPEKPEYNPLFLWNAEPEMALALLAGAGRSYRQLSADGRMAVTSVADFAKDFIRALSEGVAGAWRERWWTVDLLLVYGAEALSDTERAQDEFFHLFEALKRRGARVLLTADRPPSRIENIDERLRSRFEGGLVVEVEGRAMPDGAGKVEFVSEQGVDDGDADDWGGLADKVSTGPQTDELDEASEGPVIPPLDQIDMEGGRGGLFIADQENAAGSAEQSAPDAAPTPTPTPQKSAPGAPAQTQAPDAEPAQPVEPAAPVAAESAQSPWMPSREKVIWVWPVFEERLVEELD